MSTDTRQYYQGDKVWVRSPRYGLCPAFVTEGTDGYPSVAVAYHTQFDGDRTGVFALEAVSPRNEDPDRFAAPSKVIEPTFDPVAKARHYNVHQSGVECITIAKHMNFCLGSVLKYIWRVDDKEVPIQDLRKAIQFLEYEIERRLEQEARNAVD